MKKLVIILFSLGFIVACGTTKNTSSTTSQSKVEKVEGATNKTNEKSTSLKEEIIERPIYQASPTILTNINHTKLEVNFNWEKSQMNGVATLTCSPHFYATDSLILNAKAMEIVSISLNGNPLNYVYNDAEFLRIGLDRSYTRHEDYTITINYIAKPEEKEQGGSAAIMSDKGLYFINPTGKNKNQMPQIWTQGETEGSSVWFPTIDRPNQKTTQEIYMTVDDKYKTLSNGKLISSTKNNDGTRTDHWSQDLPHAPYLFMMAVGEFEIVEDSYTKQDGTVIPVNYYVEPEWKDDAKAIFGTTPKMMKFFSELLGVDYPWDKYHQIVVREYISGAMENTGATVFGDFVYKTTRELIDSDDQSTIAHELFHHWFGDLVTLESWSNLPLNESFANYSQYLWDEYYYGRDQADYNAESEKEGYYASANQGGHHDMIWYDYDNQEEMFDGHAYNKGGRILHMLRYYLGDDAFFLGLKNYLTKHAFKTAELADLRIAMEEVSGKDLNWFFDQWFLASYHPELKISHEINNNSVKIRIEQTQDLEKAPLYKLPMNIAIYSGGKKNVYPIVVDKNINYFEFKFEGELQNIIVDDEDVILGKFKYDKPREWYVHQYYHAPRYVDRRDALKYGTRLRTSEAHQMILDALDDDFWAIRQFAISRLDKLGSEKQEQVVTKLKNLAQNDKSSHVRSSAVKTLSNHFFANKYEEEVRTLLKNTIEKDSSYMVVSTALSGLATGSKEDVTEALSIAKSLENERSSALKGQIISLYKDYGDTSHLPFMAKTLISGEVSGYNAIGAMMSFANFFKKQEIPVQVRYFDVFETLAESGGMYMRFMVPMSLMGIKQNAYQQLSSLEQEEKELQESGNSGQATLIQRKISEVNAYIERIDKLF